MTPIVNLPAVYLTGFASTCSIGADLGDLGVEPTWFDSPATLADSLKQRRRDATIIIIGSDSLQQSESTLLELARTQGEESPHIFLIEAKEDSSLSEESWLQMANCELLPRASCRDILRKKLLRAMTLADYKNTHTEIHDVLERYAKFIDHVAEERARQLIQAERLSTLGVMSAGIAHEFNTPISYISTSLSTVQGLCERLLGPDELLAEERSKLMEKLPKAFERMSHGLERLTKISSSLKNYGANRESSQRLVHVAQVVDDALELASIECSRRIHVEREVDDSAPLVLVNPQELEQVLINLLVNASHALESISDAVVKVRVEKQALGVAIVVEDNGPGIPEDKRESIWLPFFTTKAEGKGTGLGLYICSSIIRKHRGSLEYVESSLGGAGFRLWLPRGEAC